MLKTLTFACVHFTVAFEPVAQSVVRVGIGVWHRLVPA
jgi:uncharacterized membrane protein